MKKVFLVGGIVLSLSIGFNSCRQNQDFSENNIKQEIYDKSVEMFISSNAYKRHLIFIEKKGQLALDEAITENFTYANISFEYIQIPIYKKGGGKIAKIEIVKMPNTNSLPSNDEYAVNLIDFEKFNQIKNEGVIKMYDLNYDNQMHTIINVFKNKISKKSVGIPKEILKKYSSFRKKNEGLFISESSRDLYRKHFCDSNKNGDVSFGECYKCLNDAIDQNGMSKAICDWTQTCVGTVTAACIYISAAN